MQYLRDVSEMSCGTTAIMQMRLQQDSSNHRSVKIFGRYFFFGGGEFASAQKCLCVQVFQVRLFRTHSAALDAPCISTSSTVLPC